MQFDRAEPLVPAAPPVCVLCRGILSGSYYSLQKRSVCAACGERMKGAAALPFDRARFLKAGAFGVGAVAVVGGVNWILVPHFQVDVALTSLVASVLVGFAVRLGSGNRGGRPYQCLAVLLSFLATAVLFMPLVRIRAGTLTLALVLEPLWGLLLSPFLSGVKGLLLWSVFGFVLSLAWRLNRSMGAEIRGPFALGSTMPPGGMGQV